MASACTLGAAASSATVTDDPQDGDATSGPGFPGGPCTPAELLPACQMLPDHLVQLRRSSKQPCWFQLVGGNSTCYPYSQGVPHLIWSHCSHTALQNRARIACTGSMGGVLFRRSRVVADDTLLQPGLLFTQNRHAPGLAASWRPLC